MRSFKPGNDAVPVADESPMTQTVLAFDDNRLASSLFGQYGQNLATIERKLGIVADSRGNHVTIEGSRDACDQARRVLEGLYARLKSGDEVVAGAGDHHPHQCRHGGHDGQPGECGAQDSLSAHEVILPARGPRRGSTVRA